MLAEFSTCLQSLSVQGRPALPHTVSILRSLPWYKKKYQGSLLISEGLISAWKSVNEKVLASTVLCLSPGKILFLFCLAFSCYYMEVKVFCILLRSSRRNCAGIYYKSRKVHFQLYKFQSQLWNSMLESALESACTV